MMRQKKPDLKEVRLSIAVCLQIGAEAGSKPIERPGASNVKLGTGRRGSRSRRSSRGFRRSGRSRTAATATVATAAVAAIATTMATAVATLTTMATAMATLAMMATAAVGIAVSAAVTRAGVAAVAATATMTEEQASRGRLFAAHEGQSDDRDNDRDPENKCAIHLESSYRNTGTGP
jgi:hypothetical protein